MERLDTVALHEIAFYLDRSDITEEIDRLKAHLEQIQLVVEGQKEKVVGKRLDLLTQEALREANTIAAKCASLAIAQDVMELKLSLERIREQAQNME